jgi:hypothetical protein
MELITNGFPKSGNHALVKAVQLLGQPCQVSHIPFSSEGLDNTHRIFIKRDPRNIVCSWLRFNNKPVTPGMFISAFRQFQSVSLCEEMAEYAGWLAEPNTLIVKYEDLIATDMEMRRIAAYLGVPYIPGAFENLPGLTRTWYSNHSDYNTIWTSDVDIVWANEGGAELLKTWGY